MRHLVLLLLALTAGLATSCNGSSSSRLSAMRQLDTDGMLTLAEALAIAQEAVPDGYPVGAGLELEDDDEEEPPAYEVSLYLAADDQILEVEIHAFTGAILEMEVEEDGGEEDDD